MIAVRELPGVAPAATRLEKTLRGGHLPPTWLLCGPEGTGKWALACELAAAMLCTSPTPWACGACPACKRARSFGHSDLYLVFGLPTGGGSGRARTRFQAEYIEAYLSARREAPLVPYSERRNRFIPAEQISDLIGWVHLRPNESRRKVALIYEPELIVRTVVDKLLKLTEEPPQDTSVILVSHKPDAIPPTIRSRARQVRVMRSGPRALTQILVAAGWPEPAAALAARQSRGAIGFALSRLAETEGHDPQAVALNLLGGLIRGEQRALTEVQMWQWRAERRQATEALEIWAALVRDVACASCSEPLLASADAAVMQKLAGWSDLDRAACALDLIRDTQAALATNVHIGTALLALGRRLARLGAAEGPPQRFWPRPQRV